jgi:hypothetical protein
MPLTSLELEFLQRLANEPWVSPPLFDHGLVTRLVESALVATASYPTGAIRYEITEAGWAEIARQRV